VPVPSKHRSRHVYHFSHIDNLPGLLKAGFLANSHPQFPKAKHRSIASPESKSGIRGSDKPITLPGFLRPIDTAAIARQLNLEATAKKRGRSDIPPSAASTPDAIEQQIIQKIESEWTWQGGELINNLRAYKQRLASYEVASELARLVVHAKNTLTQLREANHRAEAQIGPLREDYLAAHRKTDGRNSTQNRTLADASGESGQTESGSRARDATPRAEDIEADH
jgi:hypothetical protein